MIIFQYYNFYLKKKNKFLKHIFSICILPIRYRDKIIQSTLQINIINFLQNKRFNREIQNNRFNYYYIYIYIMDTIIQMDRITNLNLQVFHRFARWISNCSSELNPYTYLQYFCFIYIFTHAFYSTIIMSINRYSTN